MKRELIEDKGFLYAKITEDEFEKLNKIDFDDMFIQQEQILEVHNILGINNDSDTEYIRAIRNSIVKYYSDKTSKYYNDEVQDFKNYKKYQTKLSATTCALDVILEA